MKARIVRAHRRSGKCARRDGRDFFCFDLDSRLRKLRLRIASRALIHTEGSLSEIALSSGFADQSHFSREFRRQFGRTPREYREHYRAP